LLLLYMKFTIQRESIKGQVNLLIIQSKKVWIKESFIPMQIEIEDKKIIALHEYGSKPIDKDFGELMILPGFIDIHCHGYKGISANNPTEEGLREWMHHMPYEGVTSFLATTSTQAYENNVNAFKTISRLYDETGDGAEILGINIEGNFISHEFRGAQDPYTIIPPNPEILREYHALAEGRIKSVACAVEKDEGFEFCKAAKEMGIPVSVAHSGAKYEIVAESIKYGVKAATHTGNAMLGIHHREPGTFGAALLLDDLYAEVIADGMHIHFGIVKMIGRMKGKDKLILVTDSSVYKEYENGEKGSEAFFTKDGRLTGSALRVNKGVYNLIYKAGLPFETAINAATINPAVYAGESHRKGSIEQGKDADIVVCDDEFNVIAAYTMGNNVVGCE